MHPSNKPSLENASDLVNPHKLGDAQLASCGSLALGAEALIRLILQHCPDCADRTAAIRKVREAKMTAVAAISLQPAE